MTKQELALIANEAATAMVILGHDDEAKARYNEAADLYSQIGDWEAAQQMRDCADAC